MEKIKKIFKIIWKIIYALIIISMILMLMFAVVQSSSDNKKSIFGIKIFNVITGSMIPVYNIGDILIVKDVHIEEIKVGDDIVYKGEKGSYTNKTITHRVLFMEKEDDGSYKITTKGVANLGQDPEINETQVIGKVIGKVPFFNYILRFITNIYVIILIPVIILVYKNIKEEIWKK